MSQSDVFRIMLRRRWVVATVLALTLVAAVGFAAVKAKRYESTATVAFFPKLTSGGNIISSEDLGLLIATYAKDVQSQSTLSEARALDHGILPGSVQTSTQAGSGVLKIIGSASTAHNALIISRAASNAFVAKQTDNPVVRIQLIGPPSEPRSSTQPRPPLIVGLGLVVGLLAGGFLALLFDRIWKRVETEEDLAAITDVPVIGRIPREPRLHRNLSAHNEQSPKIIQESFRVLRANLQALTGEGRGVILVTSATSVQGKSTIVANLGSAFAQAGTPTVIIDADLRKPQQHAIFDVENKNGLSGLLNPSSDTGPGSEEIQKTLVEVDPHGLELLPAGPIDPLSPELLPARFPEILAHIRSLGAILLVDAPPLLAVSDARVLAAQCDSVVLVTATGEEPPKAVASAINRLTLVQCNLTGIVLNRVRPGAADETGYEYYG